MTQALTKLLTKLCTPKGGLPHLKHAGAVHDAYELIAGDEEGVCPLVIQELKLILLLAREWPAMQLASELDSIGSNGSLHEASAACVTRDVDEASKRASRCRSAGMDVTTSAAHPGRRNDALDKTQFQERNVV